MKDMDCFYSAKKDNKKMESLVKSGKMAKFITKDGAANYYDPKIYTVKDGEYILNEKK